MSEQGERLRMAALQKGYKSAASLARAMGKVIPTVTSHFNGTRGISRDEAERYGLFLRVDPSWILFGTAHKGEAPQPAADPGAEELRAMAAVQAIALAVEAMPHKPPPADQAAAAGALIKILREGSDKQIDGDLARHIMNAIQIARQSNG